MQGTTPKLLHDIESTREILGNLGRTKTYNLIAAGKLKKVKIGTRTFITDASISAYVRTLEVAAA